jgi:diguanylate cyclase (GGDEF)-like protein
LRQVLRRQDDWALLRIIVRHLDELADVYGFLAGEEVLRTTARILSEALDERGGAGDFIGHSGGDAFIIITSAKAGTRLASSLANQLEKVAQTHHSASECQQGFVTIRQSDGSQIQGPLLSTDIQMITSADGPFNDIMQLTSALG